MPQKKKKPLAKNGQNGSFLSWLKKEKDEDLTQRLNMPTMKCHI